MTPYPTTTLKGSMTQILVGSMAALLFGAACGDVAGVDGGGFESETATPGEQPEVFTGEDRSHELQGVAFTQDSLRAAIDTQGVVQLRPEHAFVAARIYIDAIAFLDVEVAYTPVGGVQTKFEPLDYVLEDESGELLAELFYPGKVETISLKFNLREGFEGVQAEDAVRYLDARFYEQAQPGDVLPLHLDEEHDEEQALELNPDYMILAQRLGLPGDWTPSAEVVRRGDEQFVAREGSPTRPSGSVRPGTRALSRYIRQNFPGVTTIGDYRVSRINGSNSYSVHSDGRALDVMIPMANPSTCSANNAVGDALAAWLLSNAEHIGVTFVIWERKSWGPYRRAGAKFRAYNRRGCTLQHADHVHVEISRAAADQRTPFFQNMSGGVRPSDVSGDPPPVSCSSATLGRRVDENSCVQQDSSKGCGWFECTGYNSYTRLSDSSSCESAQTTFGHQSCGAAPTPTPEPDFDCPSATLGRRVDENSCVQQASSRGCGWFKCTSPGSYSRLSDASSCGEEIYSHSSCGETVLPDPSGPKSQLVMTLSWNTRVDLDINVVEPSGALISYGSSQITPNDGSLSLCDPTNRGRSCYNDDVYTETITWGARAGKVEPGSYEVSVRNFDGPNASSFSIKAELYDAEGEVTVLDEFSGTSSRLEPTRAGTVVVP